MVARSVATVAGRQTGHANSPFDKNIDLKPWAAYVVGHHPYFLRLEQERNWQTVSWYGEEVSLLEWRSLEVGIERIDEALRILVLGGHVNASALVELHRAKDAFVAVCANQQACPEMIVEESSIPPGGTAWNYMIAFSEQVVASCEELELWRQFGAEVGRSQFRVWEASQSRFREATPSEHGQQVPEEGGELAVLAGRLTATGWKSFLLQLALEVDKDRSLTPSESPQTPRWAEIEHSHLELAHLDLEVRAALREEQAPQPVLILDANSIMFYGETRPLSDFTDTELACLWVLAENAGQNVERSVLMEAACLDSMERNLSSHITRIRKKLTPRTEAGSQRKGRKTPHQDVSLGRKNADEAGCQRKGRKGLPDHEKEIIKGARGRNSKNGPFMLLIDPSRVKIKAARPPWMPRA